MRLNDSHCLAILCKIITTKEFPMNGIYSVMVFIASIVFLDKDSEGKLVSAKLIQLECN